MLTENQSLIQENAGLRLLLADSDNDGILNAIDSCVQTQIDQLVDPAGCSRSQPLTQKGFLA